LKEVLAILEVVLRTLVISRLEEVLVMLEMVLRTLVMSKVERGTGKARGGAETFGHE
jgi:hypothetical protein